MKRSTSIIALLASLPVLTAWALPGTGIRFAPQAGAAVTKTMSYVMETSLDEMEMTMNGEDFAGGPKITSASTIERTIVVTDTYTKSADGRPLTLARHFNELKMEHSNAIALDMMGSESEADLHATGASELEGTTVVFEWDADDESYGCSFAGDEEGDEDLLAGLDEDLDLRVLLPADAVEVGDSWEIDSAVLVTVLFPGGQLSFEFESDGDEPVMGMADPSQTPDPAVTMGEPDGTATATFAAETEVDGSSLAEIQIEFDLESSSDLTEYFSEMIAGTMPEMPMELMSADVEWTFAGTGVLTWNVSGGHVHAFELEGEVGSINEQEMAIEAQGQSIEIGQMIDSSGTLKISVSTALAGE